MCGMHFTIIIHILCGVSVSNWRFTCTIPQLFRCSLKIIQNPMSLQRAVALARPALGQPLWKTCLFIRTTPVSSTRGLLMSQNRELKTTRFNLGASKFEGTAAESQKEAVWDVWRENVSCWWQRYGFWALIKKAGFSHDSIVRFRRKLKKIYYVTGLSTVTRAALPMIMGDLLAQLIVKYHNASKRNMKKKKKKPESWLNFINYCRTTHFAIIGGFLVGPFAKRWNLFWSRRIRRSPPGAYLLRILLLDALLLTPFIVAIYVAGYDFKYFYKTVKGHGSEGKETFKALKSRYWEPFTDVCLFYITTKPAVALVACFVVPCALQTATRRLYSIMFYCILSRTITHFKLGPEITQRKSKAFQKGQHYDGSGGGFCMLCDKVSDTLRKGKK